MTYDNPQTQQIYSDARSAAQSGDAQAWGKVYQDILQLYQSDSAAGSGRNFAADLILINQNLHAMHLLPGFEITAVSDGKVAVAPMDNPAAGQPMDMASFEAQPFVGESSTSDPNTKTGLTIVKDSQGNLQEVQFTNGTEWKRDSAGEWLFWDGQTWSQPGDRVVEPNVNGGITVIDQTAMTVTVYDAAASSVTTSLTDGRILAQTVNYVNGDGNPAVRQIMADYQNNKLKIDDKEYELIPSTDGRLHYKDGDGHEHIILPNGADMGPISDYGQQDIITPSGATLRLFWDEDKQTVTGAAWLAPPGHDAESVAIEASSFTFDASTGALTAINPDGSGQRVFKADGSEISYTRQSDGTLAVSGVYYPNLPREQDWTPETANGSTVSADGTVHEVDAAGNPVTVLTDGIQITFDQTTDANVNPQPGPRTLPDGATLAFDSQGRPLTITATDGAVIGFHYADSDPAHPDGTPSSITVDSNLGTIELTYDAGSGSWTLNENGQSRTVTNVKADMDAGTISFTDNGVSVTIDGNDKRISTANGITTTVQFDANGNKQTTIANAGIGITEQLTQQSDGTVDVVIKGQNGDQQHGTGKLDQENNLTYTTNDGRTITRDASARIVSETLPDQSGLSISYGDDGNPNQFVVDQSNGDQITYQLVDGSKWLELLSKHTGSGAVPTGDAGSTSGGDAGGMTGGDAGCNCCDCGGCASCTDPGDAGANVQQGSVERAGSTTGDSQVNLGTVPAPQFNQVDGTFNAQRNPEPVHPAPSDNDCADHGKSRGKKHKHERHHDTFGESTGLDTMRVGEIGDDRSIVYTVVPGDTFANIMWDAYVEIYGHEPSQDQASWQQYLDLENEVIAKNHIADPDVIEIGQVIKIPGFANPN